MMRFLSRCLFALCLITFLCDPAYCGMIEVRPTLLVISPSQRIAVLSLVNPEVKAAIYQVRIYRWQQNGMEQVLEPSNDIIASPPMVTIPNHGSQIIRVGLRNGDISPEEKTYRLILEEIPTEPQPADKPGLNIALRLSFPLFVRNDNDLPPPQLLSDMHLEGNDAIVTVHNKGRYTSRITHAALNIPGGHDAEKTELNGLAYVLPGGWYAYRFTLAGMPSSFRGASVELQTDEGSLDLETPLVSEAAPDAQAPASR